MNFVEAIKSCISKYATFGGRASRSEFWYFFLFCFLVLTPGLALPPLAVGIALAILLPLWAVAARRLHDIDKSGWWVLVYLVPIVGNLILFLLWNCRMGTVGPNMYGSDPLAGELPIPNSSAGAAGATIGAKTDQIAKLKALQDAGTITREEFDRMKAQVLAS